MTREEEFISIIEEKGYRYRIEGESLIVDHDGFFWIYGLTTLPSNIEFSNSEFVAFSNLTTLPSDVVFRNSGNVFLKRANPLPLEDPDLIFQNTGDVFFDDNWTSMMEEFLESRWK
jgi:hypothetical protein